MIDKLNNGIIRLILAAQPRKSPGICNQKKKIITILSSHLTLYLVHQVDGAKRI